MFLMPVIAKKNFGKESGFDQIMHSQSRKSVRFDITECPYCRYCNELGCPELTHIFCESDVAAYGNMPGIRFLRTQTLGTDGNLCDFNFERVSESRK
jgi:hypothetical protein